MVNAEVRAEFTLFGTLKRSGNWWIAYCPQLDIKTQGKTRSEAKKNLMEASELFITSCLERGTLDQALRELGFIPSKRSARKIAGNTFKMAIPIPFGFEKDLLCHA